MILVWRLEGLSKANSRIRSQSHTCRYLHNLHKFCINFKVIYNPWASSIPIIHEHIVGFPACKRDSIPWILFYNIWPSVPCFSSSRTHQAPFSSQSSFYKSICRNGELKPAPFHVMTSEQSLQLVSMMQ